jgi:predicted ATP-grasp superfamily ATP-dependent carboligase
VDDEAAALTAEHAAEPSKYFIFPPIALGLPRALASKQKLYEMCRQYSFPASAIARPATGAKLAAFAVGATFPVVGKNAEPWVRRRAPVVSHSSVLDTAEELLAIAPPTDVVQECAPREPAEDWFVHLYFDANSNCLLTFTGVKIRSCPPHAGATAAAYAAPKPALARLAERLARK